jgi:hypothetical protein
VRAKADERKQASRGWRWTEGEPRESPKRELPAVVENIRPFARMPVPANCEAGFLVYVKYRQTIPTADNPSPEGEALYYLARLLSCGEGHGSVQLYATGQIDKRVRRESMRLIVHK